MAASRELDLNCVVICNAGYNFSFPLVLGMLCYLLCNNTADCSILET